MTLLRPPTLITPQARSVSPTSARLSDFPNLQQQIEEGERLHYQRDFALQQAVHELVRRLQKQLRTATERYNKLEETHRRAVKEVEQLRQAAEENQRSHEMHEREMVKLRRSEVTMQDDAADLSHRIAAREASVRENLQWIAGRELELTNQESTLAQRSASFEATMEARQNNLDADAAHVQRMTLHAQQLLDDASQASEASASRRLEVERMRRGLEEAITIQNSELQHRQRLVNESISEREAYIEQRLHACASLEIRLRQWASDINTEVAGHARIREEELHRRESALTASTKQLELRERQQAEQQRAMEAERQELLLILSSVEVGSSAAGEDGLRALQRLRRIRTVLHSHNTSGDGASLRDHNTSATRSTFGDGNNNTPMAHRSSLGSTSLSATGVVGGGAARRVDTLCHADVAHPPSQHNLSAASSAFAVSRASSEGRRSPHDHHEAIPSSDPRFLRSEELRGRQPLASTFRLPGNASTWMWSAESHENNASTLGSHRSYDADAIDTASTVSSAPPAASAQYFQERRLQRSPPERRVITSPLKLKESKGSFQDPLS